MVTERFLDLADAVAQSRNTPDIPRVVLPSEMESLSDQELAAQVDETLEETARTFRSPVSAKP